MSLETELHSSPDIHGFLSSGENDDAAAPESEYFCSAFRVGRAEGYDADVSTLAAERRRGIYCLRRVGSSCKARPESMLVLPGDRPLVLGIALVDFNDLIEYSSEDIFDDEEKDKREDFLRTEKDLSDALVEKELALVTADKLVKELREELAFLKEQEASVNKENKSINEGFITIHILKEQNADAVRKQIAELKTARKDASAQDKEKRKQKKMAMMMAKFDTQGAFSEKDEQLHAILGKLDTIDSAGYLSQEDLTAVRRQLSEGQNMIREKVDRLQQSLEENEMITRRRDELETRVAALETEYEELLEKMIHDEETSNNKLEAQYAAPRDAHISESVKSVNDELKRAFAVTSAGIEGGKNPAESAKDLSAKSSRERGYRPRQSNFFIQQRHPQQQQQGPTKEDGFLERNLEQLTLLQKQLVDHNSTLKKEAGIAERKLLARNERIQNLEALLQDTNRRLSLQNQKFEAQLQAVKERLDQAGVEVRLFFYAVFIVR
ncbi:hypothetical protein B0H13DRAFT_2521650 [Mycena leptocephala]|nr:hypothetical protein B0H13DRAFT_2521650 [Mycena leptocephala]